MPTHYYNRRRRKPHGRLEMAVTVITLVVVIVTLVVFLAIYHDLPFRLSGGY